MDRESAKRIQAHIAKFGSGDKNAIMRAERYLIRYGPRAVDQLITATRDEHPMTRLYAGWVLGKIGDSRAFPALLALLDDGHPDVRYDAAIALGYLGDRRAIEPLSNLIKQVGADGIMASAAANGIQKFGKATVPALVDILRDGNSDARVNAAYILGVIGDKSVVRELAALKNDTDNAVQVAVTEILEEWEATRSGATN